MSKITRRHTAPRDAGSAERSLERLLESPLLTQVVPHLPPEALHHLIRSRGIEACGDLVTAATPAQLTSLLDLDLWQQVRPGGDELFDVERFGEWLEVLVDAGPSVAARTVAALGMDLVITGLSRYVRVFDPGIFEPTAQSDDEPPDRLESMREGDSGSGGERLEYEVGGYIVRARRADTWDAIVMLLAALEDAHGSYFDGVMRGCRRLSNSAPEIDGLDDLLPAPEQQVHQVTGERDRRRSQRGYATAADARAFLEMARQPAQPGSSVPGSMRINPIVRAYFRAADEISPHAASSVEGGLRRAPAASSRSASTPLPPRDSLPSETHDSAEVPQSIEAVMEVLTEAGVMPKRPLALIGTADSDPRAARLTHLRRLMAAVGERNEAACFTRTRELAFLANTLLAGGTVQSRRFSPQEASDAAAAICNLGLEYWPARWPGVSSVDSSAPDRLDGPAATPPEPPDSLLIDHDLVTAFEVGWSALYQKVSLFTANQLTSVLRDIDSVDPDIRHSLAALRRTLAKEREAGTPWRARGAAEVLAMLDMTAWVSVLGLLDECPVIPAAMTAVLERRTKTVSPTEFDFISTAAQIDSVRAFMRKLPGLLTG
jgi:hypothetical protein